MAKKGRLSQSEKDQIVAKVGDEKALKRLAKKLDRSVETLQAYLASLKTKVEAAPEATVEVQQSPAPIDRPATTDMWGNAKTAQREQGVVVATERSSNRVDIINKQLGHNTVESIIKRKPDCTARIR